MGNELHMEIHVHKLNAGKKYRVMLINDNSTIEDVVVSGTKSRDDLVWHWCDLYNTIDIIIHDSKKTEFKYSEIPSIPVLEEADAEEFFEDNEEFVYNRVMQAVAEGIQASVTDIRLFELNGTGEYITSKRENWEAGLRSALAYYESVEKYEACDIVAKLIQQL
jgi:hypothetical protein